MKDLRESILQKSKKIYDNIEIPEELSQVVDESIRHMDEKRKAGERNSEADRRKIAGSKENFRNMDRVKKKKGLGPTKVLWRTLSTAAAVLICFSIGLNSNQAFAMEMSQLPIVGRLAKVLTVRSYEEQNEETGINLAVEVPAVEVEENAAGQPGAASQEGTKQNTSGQIAQPSLAVDVNAEIEKIVNRHLAKAEEDFAAYKKAFFETGGTEEDWAGRTMDVIVDYEIKFQDEARVSFVLYLEEAWVASYQEEYYYNLDLAENRELTLEDVLGADYVEIANNSILTQMKERMAENEDYVYWGMKAEEDGPVIEGFTTVDENTTFYINEAGNPVVTFPKYAVAPGFMGVQEFEIVKP
ncbi:MAG: RsiV family protein [Lachnospiraceae bacterium]|nr:RsiV family protein [Lachnospiraceae bacterium]MDY5701201.1 RsiV family protein [Lachnospiraceae bacterium]